MCVGFLSVPQHLVDGHGPLLWRLHVLDSSMTFAAFLPSGDVQLEWKPTDLESARRRLTDGCASLVPVR